VSPRRAYTASKSAATPSCNVCGEGQGQVACGGCGARVHRKCLSLSPEDTRFVGQPADKLQIRRHDMPSGRFTCDKCSFSSLFGRDPAGGSREDKYLVDLIRAARVDTQHYIARSTRAAYSSPLYGKDSIMWFEEEIGVRLLPRAPGGEYSLLGVQMWLEHYERSGGREGKGRAASTLRRVVAAIASFCNEAGTASPFDESWALQKQLQGILRRIGTEPNQQHPVHIELLRHMLTATIRDRRLGDVSFAESREVAQHLMHFFGAYRGSEVYSLKGSDVALVRVGDFSNGREVREGEQHVRITLRGSKTDQLSHVLDTVICGVTSSGIDIFAAVEEYIERRGRRGLSSSDPFFVMDSGKPVSNDYYRNRVLRPRLAGLQRSGLRLLADVKIKDFGSHSMRRGFVVSAMEQEVEADLIENQGRWSWRLHRMVKHYGAFTLTLLLSATRAL
jgi:hypothetical protein